MHKKLKTQWVRCFLQNDFFLNEYFATRCNVVIDVETFNKKVNEKSKFFKDYVKPSLPRLH